MRRRNVTTLAGLIGATAFGLTACSSSESAESGGTGEQYGMSGDRSEYFNSVDGLAAASTAIVSVHVTAHDLVDSGGPLQDTIVTAAVDASYEPDGLGSDLDLALTPLSPGEEIRIYQYGTADTASLAPILEAGGEYLLFLVRASDEENGYPAGSPRAGTFDIVGVEAGIYQARETDQPETSSYERTNPNSGDELPETIKPEESL